MRYGKRAGMAVMVAAGILVLGGCGGAESESAGSSIASSAATSSAAPSSAGSHNAADVAFVQGMIPHHQQAIEMCDVLLAKQGVDTRVVAVARRIAAAQRPEITRMQQWLSQWGSAPMSARPSHDMSAMPSHAMPSHAMSGHAMPSHAMSGHAMPDMSGEMPGMPGGHGTMSAADMAALRAASGAAAGHLFLRQMIEHHQGAVTMAQQEIAQGRSQAAVALARSIVTTQQAEITEMQGLLTAR
ncbi:MAG: DUF305 domain-containing protein [Gordonia sp. (in: high G+C Gram-positive bacteria)]